MNLTQSRWYKPLLVALALGLLVSAHFSQRRLNTLRGELGLTRLEPLRNAPPILTLTTVVLGGFRGLIANALWVRAIELQDEDKFFEKVQLADWITKLQPHNATVWTVQAWDMSYNISIKFTDLAERWNWVLRGIELLRDEALFYNPDNVDIYQQLAWHFQHKIGQNLDDGHLYYKSVWAGEMDAVLGGGRPNFEELMNPATDDARARVKLLREKYKMDPVLMKGADDAYGPLEWRLPEAHAIYWAYVGKQKAATKDDLIKLRRVLYQSMFLAFHRGEIQEVHDGTVEFGPNLAIAEKTHATYEEAMAEDAVMRDHISRAHKNFLLDAVYFNYVHNRPSESERWFQMVKDRYPNDVPKGLTMEEYAIGVRLQEDVGETDMNRMTGHLRGMIMQSYLNLARNRDDEAVGYAALARNLWNIYMNKVTSTKSDHRVPLVPLDQMKRDAVRKLLDPETGLVPEMAAVLRTKLPEMAAEVEAEIRDSRPPVPVAPPE